MSTSPSKYVPHELHPKESKEFTSAINKYSMDSGYDMDIIKAFKIIDNRQKPLLPDFAMAIAIKRF